MLPPTYPVAPPPGPVVGQPAPLAFPTVPPAGSIPAPPQANPFPTVPPPQRPTPAASLPRGPNPSPASSTAGNPLRMASTWASPNPLPACQTLPRGSIRPKGPPSLQSTRGPRRIPVGIPQFAKALDNVNTGLRPSLNNGLDWLAAHGYRTVVQIRTPGDDDSANSKQVEKRGMQYVSIEVSPPTLTKAVVQEFTRLIATSQVSHCSFTTATAPWRAFFGISISAPPSNSPMMSPASARLSGSARRRGRARS